MKNHLARMSLSFFSCLLLLAAGCCINIGCWPQAKYEKTIQASVPLAAGSTMIAETDVGSITVTGAEANDCNVVAKICVKASNETNAQKLAEQVKLKLEPVGKTLAIKIEKPCLKNCVTYSFDITVPRQTALQLESDVGKILISGTTGQINARSDVGDIICKEISGDIDLRTDVGKVKVIYMKTAPAAINATISTDVGNIDFTGPPNLSAQTDIRTDVGSINTSKEIKVSGKISKNKLKGTIGDGQGKLHLTTDVGSIEIN